MSPPSFSMQLSLKRHHITKRSSDLSLSFCNSRGRRVGTAASPNSLPTSHSIQVSLDDCETFMFRPFNLPHFVFPVSLSDCLFYIKHVHFVVLSPQIKRRFSGRGWSLFRSPMTIGRGPRVEQGAWAEELGALEVLEEAEEEYWGEVSSTFCKHYKCIYNKKKSFPLPILVNLRVFYLNEELHLLSFHNAGRVTNVFFFSFLQFFLDGHKLARSTNTALLTETHFDWDFFLLALWTFWL